MGVSKVVVEKIPSYHGAYGVSDGGHLWGCFGSLEDWERFRGAVDHAFKECFEREAAARRQAMESDGRAKP